MRRRETPRCRATSRGVIGVRKFSSMNASARSTSRVAGGSGFVDARSTRRTSASGWSSICTVSEQRLQLHRGAESLFLEVGLDAGKARGEAGAEADVVVDAEDGDIIGDGEVGCFAGVEDFRRDEVAGRQHGRGKGERAEEGGEFVRSRRSTTLPGCRGEGLAGVAGLGERCGERGLAFAGPDFVTRVVYEREGPEGAERKEVAGGGAADRRVVHAEVAARGNGRHVALREDIHEHRRLALPLKLFGNAGPGGMREDHAVGAVAQGALYRGSSYLLARGNDVQFPVEAPGVDAPQDADQLGPPRLSARLKNDDHLLFH